MKKVIVLALVLATALAGAVPALAQQQGAEQYVSGDTSNVPPGASGGGIVGSVTEISGSVVLVEADPAAESGDKGYFTVTDRTEITRLLGGDALAPATFEEVEVGQRVEASYAGAVAESYPTQGDAATIAILEDLDCPVVGGCKDPGQPSEEVAATGVIEPLADNADADHGITDEATSTFYALQGSGVDLDAYADGGQRVTVYGTLAQTFVATEHPVLNVTGVEVLGGTQQPPPPPPGDVATFTYELAVECEPPEGAEFFGFIATESAVTTPLTDPDGDGVHAGSLKTPKFAPGGSREEPIAISPVRMLQGPPVGAGPLGPEYRVIRDFGAVKAEDTTLSASVSFCDGNGGSDDDTNGDDGPAPVVSGDTNDGDEGGDVPGGPNGGGSDGGLLERINLLPATGGAWAVAGLTGLALVAGGLLVRRKLTP